MDHKEPRAGALALMARAGMDEERLLARANARLLPAARMSRADLAAFLGGSRVTRPRLKALARALGVTPTDLLSAPARAYDPDEAAALLAARFGPGAVSRGA